MNTVSCPICERPLDGTDRANLPYFPFCSDRCRVIDLGRWLGETYRVPSADDEADEITSEDDESVP